VKFKLKNDWPVNSTIFLLPTIALRGFGRCRFIVLAWWTWQLNIKREGGE